MEEPDENRNVKEGSKREIMIEKCTPYLLCICGNIGFGGFNIITKIALNKGMSRYVLVVYGNLFGTLASAPLALIFERKNNAKISLLVFRDIVILGLLGDVLGRTLFFAGIEYTSTTMAAAMSNLMPSITLLFAVLCRMEKLELSKTSSQAKIVGTVVAFGGATVMTLYKGLSIISMGSLLHDTPHQTSTSHSSKDWIKGSLMIFATYVSVSAFYILQGRTVKMYPAPIALTSLTCLSGTLQSAVMAVILDHRAASWRLSWDVTLLAPLYNGVVFLALTMYVQTLVIQRRGPVFMTAFRPLGTIIVVIMGLFILGEPLHLGSVVGAIVIILGLYMLLWGKEKEIKEQNWCEHSAIEKDIAMPSNKKVALGNRTELEF